MAFMSLIFADTLAEFFTRRPHLSRGKHARRLQRKNWRRSCRLQRSAARLLAIRASQGA